MTNSEKDRNVEGNERNGRLGFIWKTLGKISIEPAVIIMNLAWTMYWVQTPNLYIEKTCKVGSFFFGNGTTFSNEVFFYSKISHILTRISSFLAVLLRFATISSMEHFPTSKSMCRQWWPTWRWCPT